MSHADIFSEMQRASLKRVELAGVRGCTSGEIAQEMGCHVGRVSQSMRKLLRRGRVFGVKEGKQYVFVLTPELAEARKSLKTDRFAVVKQSEGVAPTVTLKNHGRTVLHGEATRHQDFKRTEGAHYRSDIRFSVEEFVGPLKPVFTFTGATLADCYVRSAA